MSAKFYMTDKTAKIVENVESISESVRVHNMMSIPTYLVTIKDNPVKIEFLKETVISIEVTK